MPNKLEKKVGRLSIAQKRIIVDKYQEPQPNGKPLSIRQLSEYFTAKWKKKVGKSVIHRIIENKHEILTMQKTDKRVKLKQSIEVEFEEKLTEKMLETHKRPNITWEIGKVLAQRIQNERKFQDAKIQKLQFSRKWWREFCKRHGWSWTRNRGEMKIIPKENLDEERARIRNMMKDYELRNIVNVDESAVFVNQTGNYGMQPRELSGRELKNNKERITVTTFISADGEIVFNPSFILRNFPREMKSGKSEWEKGSTAARFFDNWTELTKWQHFTSKYPRSWSNTVG